MKRLFLVPFLALLTSCVSESGGNLTENDTNFEDVESNFISAGMYQATNGNGYSEFHQFKLDEDSYLDITNYLSTVALYDSSLALIDNSLEGNDFIPSGEYNLKFTYEPTSLDPGNVTIFSLELEDYNDLTNIESETYNANSSYGSYSEYYKLNFAEGGYIDVTATNASVFIYNKTLYGDDGMSINTHYESAIGNSFLEAGEYVVKFTYAATVDSPGNVSFQKPF
jgi:hypothetical protein